MAGFSFPEKFTFEGQVWQKIYDPAIAGSQLPNLDTPKVNGPVGGWLQVPYAGKLVGLYIVAVDLFYPAISSAACVKGAQIVRGFRFFTSEVSPDSVPPREFVMYIRDAPREDNTLQGFVNALLGVTQPRAPEETNVNWAKTILDEASATQQPAKEDKKDGAQ